jgi:hypothetical protein
LTARAAATSKPGRYGDGGGLWLVVSGCGARKWVYRFTFGGKVTEMGLGSAAVISLAQARDKASGARKILAAGQNPIEARRKATIIEAGKPTFGVIANAFIAAKEGEWRNEKHRAQWRVTLEKYAASLSAHRVDQIDTAAVLAVLTPLWREKPETASRLRGAGGKTCNGLQIAGITFRIFSLAPMRADRFECRACCISRNEPRPQSHRQNAASVGLAGFEEMSRQGEIDAIDAIRRDVEQPRHEACDVIGKRHSRDSRGCTETA